MKRSIVYSSQIIMLIVVYYMQTNLFKQPEPTFVEMCILMGIFRLYGDIITKEVKSE